MKKNICFVILAIFCTMTFSVDPYAEETWKITSLNWEPYSGAEMTNQGNSVQLLQELLRKEGIRLIVEFYPWKRAQMKAKGKDYVGYFPAWPEEVADGFTASPVVDWSEVGILKNAESKVEYETIDDLFRNYKIGIVHTYVYPELIADAMKKYPRNVDGAPDEITLLKKLSKARHPVAITDPNVMTYLAQRNGIDNIEAVSVIMKKELVVALRKDEDNERRIRLLERLLKNR